jgi:hypothetical protein
MKAELWTEERLELQEGIRVELIIWPLPMPVRASVHFYKYRLALIDSGVCVLRYDNEAGKGDHKHIGEEELAYAFSTVEALRKDFMADVKSYMGGKR